jgi:hypothetical protein
MNTTYTKYVKNYQKTAYDSRMLIARVLLGGKCVNCSSISQLEIDHIDPRTKFRELSSLTLYSLDRFLEELEKCQLLCRVCHEEKTLREWGYDNKGVRHGSLIAYLNKRCRCTICKEGNNKRSKEYRQRRKPKLQEKQQVICGTRNEYLRGCRCAECRKAQAETQRAYKRNKN